MLRRILLLVDRAAQLLPQGLLVGGRHLLYAVDVEVSQIFLTVQQLLKSRVSKLLDLLPLPRWQIAGEQLRRLSYIFPCYDVASLIFFSSLVLFITLVEA